MLQENPADLLRETIEGCDIETDLDTIDRISENLAKLQNERELKIGTKQEELKQLSIKLTNKENLINEIMNSSNRKKILDEMNRNEIIEFEINKNLKNLTSLKQNFSNELSLLIDQFNKLEKEIVEFNELIINENNEVDSNLLKLIIYKKFGIKLNLNDKKVIIFNKKLNLTDILDYDDEKLSNYFISNFIWERL